MPAPLSAFIITKDEEARLPATLTALRGWVDEIVVVDSGSTDRTVEIARTMGATVIHRDWTGYGPQKRFAEDQCRNDWLLNVDADEVVTPELAAEIQALFAASSLPQPGAFNIRILNVYPGDLRPRPLANDYNVVRLYHRSAGRYSDHPLHDRVNLATAKPEQLASPIHHYPYLSFEQALQKHNRFSSFSASQSKRRGGAALRLRLFTEFPVSFVKFYFFRRHILGGWKGFYFALANAFMRTTRIAKMLEATGEHRASPETGTADQAPSARVPTQRSG
jgi:glycosyltransferase involved in cell wall biosynthesis